MVTNDCVNGEPRQNSVGDRASVLYRELKQNLIVIHPRGSLLPAVLRFLKLQQASLREKREGLKPYLPIVPSFFIRFTRLSTVSPL